MVFFLFYFYNQCFFVHLEQPPTVFIVARMGTKCLCLFLSDIAWVCKRELSGQQFAIENVVISYHIFLCKKELKNKGGLLIDFLNYFT